MSTLSQTLYFLSQELGFDDMGIAPCGSMEEQRVFYMDWIQNGYQAGMGYMERNIDKRLDPGLLVEGAKSVIVLLKNYFPENSLPETDNYILAKYAYGNDYHDVIREKLNILVDTIKAQTGSIQTRGFVDSAPVLERAWAVRAGLGWIGKNSCLIHPQEGSFFFISVIITDQEMEYSTGIQTNLCGSCRRCLDSCPTGAIVQPMVIDARKCISYLTIENKGEIPEDFKRKFKNRIFGCDICQDVCPWNRKPAPHQEPSFRPEQALLMMNRERWRELTKAEFDNLFRKSAVKRSKYSGLMRNVNFASEEND